MVNFVNQLALFRTLRSPSQLVLNILAGLALSSIVLGNGAAIANPQAAQITLSIEATFAPTFSNLVSQAEAIAETEVSQRFQSDPTLSEIQITVLGERNGQLVSLLASRISRSAWQADSNIRQWTRYFSTSSALLGYRNSDPTSTRVPRSEPVLLSRTPSPQRTSSEMLEQARLDRRISEVEYWQFADAMD
jgi:hypothetical protein